MEGYNGTILKNYCEEFFSEYSSIIEKDLKKKNARYHKISEKQLRILNKHPNIEAIFNEFNDNQEIRLEPNDVKALRKYIHLIYESQFYIEKEMFKRGMKEEYYLLKKLRLLK